MPIRITSLVSSGPLWITLTSGEQIRLAPGQTSGERADVDVEDNPSIASMASRGFIEVTSVTGGRRGSAGGTKKDANAKAAGVTGDDTQREP